MSQNNESFITICFEVSPEIYEIIVNIIQQLFAIKQLVTLNRCCIYTSGIGRQAMLTGGFMTLEMIYGQ